MESQDIVNKFIDQRKSLEVKKDRFLENCHSDEETFDNSEDSGARETRNTDVKDNFHTNKIQTKRLKKVIKNKKSAQITSNAKKSIPKKTKTSYTGKTAKNQRCCSEEFNTKTEYCAHLRLHGGVRKTYKCSKCDKKYVSNFELEVHLRKHSGEKPFTCSICEKSFTDKRNLKKHEKIHSGNRAYECSVCQKKFLHSFTLKIHERTHSGEKPYICDSCGKSFNTLTELKIHYRTHTKEKPYECNICEKAFSSKAALNIHMIVHTGDRKYSCTICSRKCRTSYDLKTHMRCHSNEKPYVCNYTNCDKKYKNNSQLNVHLRTHQGDKPHQCTVCLKQFGESNTLRRHMGIHEKNEKTESTSLLASSG